MQTAANRLLVVGGVVATAAGLTAYWLYNAYKEHKNRYWHWDQEDLDDLSGLEIARKECQENALAKEFLFGTATAAHQIEGGCKNNNWAEFEETKLQGQGAGMACESWEKWREDIALMVGMGTNSYRFSVEWSKIEAEEGVFDEDALRHYSDIIDVLLHHHILPVITLHHFCHPIWYDRLGGMEKMENIKKYFLRFATRVFTAFSDRVSYWCTFNETEVFVSLGYFQGDFPPGKKDPYLAGIVLGNMLEGHVLTYRTLKALPHGSNAQIGLVKNLTHFDPCRWWHPLDHYVANSVNHVFNGTIRTFFQTGHFNFSLFGLFSSSRYIADAPGAADFIGLNYYSHYHVQFALQQDPFIFVRNNIETQTDMDYPIYAEGISRALEEVASYGANYIIITENGVADKYDDRRALWIRRYLYAVSKTIKEKKVKVRGYFYWSLLDNYEWDKGYKMQFGLHTRDRKAKASLHHYTDIIKRILSSSQ